MKENVHKKYKYDFTTISSRFLLLVYTKYILPSLLPKVLNRKKNPSGLPSNSSLDKTSLTAFGPMVVTTRFLPILKPTTGP